MNTDYHGKPVPDNESPDKIIDVWEIEPSLDTSYDYVTIRSYQDAVEYAKQVVEELMDNLEQEFPIKIEIRKGEMTVGAYLELQEEE